MKKPNVPIKTSDLWSEDKLTGMIMIYSDRELALRNYSLNETGSLIWKLCDGKREVRQIALELFSSISGNKPNVKIIEKEVKCYLDQLKNVGLISWQKQNLIDVLLLVPQYPSVYGNKAVDTPEYSSPPLGLAYLAAILKKNDYTVKIIDMHIQNNKPEDVIKLVNKYNPHIIGITSTTPTFPNVVKLARYIKAFDENIKIIVGGPHPTCAPEEVLNNSLADFVVMGEGEEVVLDLVNHILGVGKSLNSINGIAFRDKRGKIKYTPPRKNILNLDKIPHPARELLPMGKYYKKGSIISSRGCPYNCNYCSCSLIAGFKYRKHSVNYVLDEVKMLQQKYGIRSFDFHDDTFNLLPQRVFDFCEEIKRRNMKIKWGCFCRVTNFDYKTAFAMKQAGCYTVQFGVESGSDIILKKINKKITTKGIESAIKAAKKAGLKQIACGFIIGHENETEETANQTISFGLRLAKLGATRLNISLLTPYPGTQVFNEIPHNGIKLITKDWEKYVFSKVVIETKYLSQDKLRELYTKGVEAFLMVSK